MNKSLVIFGASEQAELAYYYFSRDSGYEISAFTIDSIFINDEFFCGLPIVAFEDILELYPPQSHDIFVAIGYSNINQVRKAKYLAAKSLGYDMASYISSNATILNDKNFGDNCFILEDNTIQPFVRVGNNVTIWSGNHIGHHSVISDHCFITSHVVVSGGVKIDESCFLGVNSTLRDHISIGERTVIGASALILGDVEPEGVYVGKATERSKIPSNRIKKI